MEGQLFHRKTSCPTQNEQTHVRGDCKVPRALCTAPGPPRAAHLRLGQDTGYSHSHKFNAMTYIREIQGIYWSLKLLVVDGPKQDNSDQKQVSHSLRDEGVFTQELFEKEHARGIHLSFLLTFTLAWIYVSLEVQGEMEIEILELILLCSFPRDALNKARLSKTLCPVFYDSYGSKGSSFLGSFS